MLQIHQMGTIYTSAQVTLVACAGKDVAHGLPGVSSPRMSPGKQNVGPVTLSLVAAKGGELITGSSWSTRGWTFQEGYLSNRRVFFTDHQVVYVCNTGAHHEYLGEDEHGFLGDFKACLQSSTSTVYEARDMVTNYSKRRLTYQNDALNAITGVLNLILERNINDKQMFRHIYGLPLYSWVDGDNEAISIETSLHWYHTQRGVRRPEFPSWSPLGWNGAGRTDGAVRFHTEQPSVPLCGEIDFSKNGRQYSLQSLFKLGVEASQSITAETASLLRVTAFMTELRLENINWDPLSSKCNHMENGAHLILPLSEYTIDLCIAPEWDDAALDLTGHDLLPCAMLVQDPNRLSDWQTHTVLVLKSHGTYYERIGCFDIPQCHSCVLPMGHFSKHIYRTKSYRWPIEFPYVNQHTHGSAPFPCIENAQKRTFLLG
jgi:hypothetical protein